MNYTEFIVKNKEYKLRLGAGQIRLVESKLGYNVLDIFLAIDSGKLPMVSDALTILHGSLQQYHHNMSMQKVESLYDSYIDDGNSYMDLMPVLIDLFRQSGLIGNNDENDEEDMEAETEGEQ